MFDAVSEEGKSFSNARAHDFGDEGSKMVGRDEVRVRRSSYVTNTNTPYGLVSSMNKNHYYQRDTLKIC